MQVHCLGNPHHYHKWLHSFLLLCISDLKDIGSLSSRACTYQCHKYPQSSHHSPGIVSTSLWFCCISIELLDHQCCCRMQSQGSLHPQNNLFCMLHLVSSLTHLYIQNLSCMDGIYHSCIPDCYQGNQRGLSIQSNFSPLGDIGKEMRVHNKPQAFLLRFSQG